MSLSPQLPILQPNSGHGCCSIPSNIEDTSVGYKASLYNIFVEEPDYVLAFNSRSSALLKFSAESYAVAQEIIKDPNRCTSNEEHTKIKAGLVSGQFLIPSSLDEMAWLKVKNTLTRFSNPALSLVIAPTLRCNFSCKYCYVDLNANKMSGATIQKVSKFFLNKLHDGAGASVVFTGGDPSLAMDVVEALSTDFIAHCKTKNASYTGVLITNGYLLNDRMLAALERSQIQDIQISIDGYREFHDYTRHLANKRSTYERILDNIVKACRRIRCHLRVNVSSINYGSIPNLIDDLVRRGLAGKVFPYFARLDSPNEQSAGFADKVLSLERFAEMESQFAAYSVERGFTLSGKLAHETIGRHCSANAANAFTIDSNAQLMKCYEDLGHAKEKGIGYIDVDGNEVITAPERLVRWLSWDPFAIQMCRECKVLPVCMGGCSYEVIYSDGRLPPGCITSRFNYADVVKIYSDAIRGGHAHRVRCRECSI